MLLVVERDGYIGRDVSWKCLCDCGKTKITTGPLLKTGKTKSCGCLMQTRATDLTGHRFGNLSVASRAPSIKDKARWNVECDCGNAFVVFANSLMQGLTVSCGCLKKERASSQGRANLRDLTGERFGRLLVVGRSKRKDAVYRTVYWDCICECGASTVVSTSSLRQGKTQSCGCYKVDRFEYDAAMKRLEEELAADCDNCGGDDVREENGFDRASYDVCVDCGDVSPMREVEAPIHRQPTPGATNRPPADRAALPSKDRRLPWSVG